jgi:hypothetical protein
LNVTNQAPGSTWPVSANLKIWLDKGGTTTTGQIKTHSFTTSSPLVLIQSDPVTKDSKFTTTFNSSTDIVGNYVLSSNNMSYTTVSSKRLVFRNKLVYTNNTNIMKLEHSIKVIKSSYTIQDATGALSDVSSTVLHFPLNLNISFTSYADGNFRLDSSIYHALKEEVYSDISNSHLSKRIHNVQTGDGFFGPAVGRAATRQEFSFYLKGDVALDGIGVAQGRPSACFYRNVRAEDRVVITDRYDDSSCMTVQDDEL